MLTKMLLSLAVTVCVLTVITVLYFSDIQIFGGSRPLPRIPTPEPTRILKRADQVILQAKSWNNGMVHVWADLAEGPNARYTDVAGGTLCDKVDDRLHALGTGATAIYYHKLRCGDLVGYVEVDQAR